SERGWRLQKDIWFGGSSRKTVSNQSNARGRTKPSVGLLTITRTRLAFANWNGKSARSAEPWRRRRRAEKLRASRLRRNVWPNYWGRPITFARRNSKQVSQALSPAWLIRLRAANGCIARR